VLRIVSSKSKRFRDRVEAGRLLAQELIELYGQRVVVLGIPRGGIVVAREMAHALVADLDIVLARKLRTPGQWELAMGSVAEDGKLFVNERVAGELGVSESEIMREKAIQLNEIDRRRQLIRKIQPKVALKDRVVLVTDDGVATGSTAQAALWAVRQENPRKLIAAFPVGAPDTLARLAEYADEVVCLSAPSLFFAVGQFYERFEPVEDEDVLEILKEEVEMGRARAKAGS